MTPEIATVRNELAGICESVTDERLAQVDESVRPFLTQTKLMATIALKLLDRAEEIKDTCAAVAHGWGDVNGVGVSIAQYIREKV